MDLQIALLLIGVIVIIGVALTAYDKGRLARSVRRGLSFSSGPAVDVPRREPVIPHDASRPTAGPASAAEPERKFLKSDAAIPANAAPAAIDPLVHALGDIEEVANRPLNLNPGFDPPGTGPEAALEHGVQVEPNEAIDFIILLPGPGPVSRRSALAVYKQNEYKLEYPRQLYGRRHQTSFWSVVQHDSEATQYSDLKLAVQLIDAPGPIGESELNTFVQVALKLADALHRPPKFSMPFEQALARARELQRFYDEHDVVAGVNIAAEPNAPFKGRAIVAAAERAGMRLGAGNVFHKRSDARPLYSLCSPDKGGGFNPADWDAFRTNSLSLYMSVPGARNPLDVFDSMIRTAKEMTTALGARLLDQDQRPLTDKGIAAIRVQIQAIDAKMRAFGIAPGSEAAQRLFAAD